MTEYEDRRQRQEDIFRALDRNRQRRGRAEWELEQARQELAQLLAAGAALPWPLKIAPMARDAGISRETAYKLLRRHRGGG